MEPLLFQDFLRKGPERGSRELRGQPRAQRAFLRRLLQTVPLEGGPGRTEGYVPSGEEYATWLEWLITSPAEGENPTEYIERVQDEYGAKSNVCGRIWGKGYVAYRCRTCGMSPCSAICHECFEKGPHRNHNFLMYRSVAGGCCDCGDPGAWKASGFCSSHKGPPASFHLPMPELELRGAFNCIYDVVSHVTAALSAHYDKLPLRPKFDSSGEPSPDDELPPYCSKSLKLLQELCTYGDVYRRIVCSATLGDIGLANPRLRGSPYGGCAASSSPAAPPLLSMRASASWNRALPFNSPCPPASPKAPPPAIEKTASVMSIDDDLAADGEGEQGPLLECLILSATHLSVEISTLFLQMLFDFDFKKEFTRVFIRYYGRFMRTILQQYHKKEIPTRMVDISVQLFSNSMLTVQMIREEALLSTLFRNIMMLVEEQGELGAGQLPDHITLNCEHHIWTKRTYWPITNDLVNILSHRAVVAEFLTRVDIVKEWLQVARRFQGIDAHVREIGTHIELENRHWTSPFFIELELVMEQLSLLDAGVKVIMSSPMVPVPGERATSPVQIISAMQQILALGIETCQEWLQSDAVGMQSGAGGGAETVPLLFNVHQRPVTLHIPLHRFVAFFASQVCRHCDLPLRDIFPMQQMPSFIRTLVEHPLRIQVLLAQIRAGMWRLNGETMFRRGWFYRSAYFYDLGFDLDLFILQCAAVLLHPDELMLTLVDRFGLCTFLGFTDARVKRPDADEQLADATAVGLPSDDPDVCTVVAEDMLVLIAAILSERARLGLTDDECIRQEVIARLCVKLHSHSQLTESICRRWNEHDNFESVLLEVANFEAPQSHRMEQGKYRLKPEYSTNREAYLVHILVRSFNHGDYEAAIEQLREAEKGEKGEGGGAAGASESAAAANGEGQRGKTLMMSMPRAFRDILRLLHSPVLHHVVYTVLLNTVSGKSSTSVHIDMALWLLQAALEQPVEASETAPSDLARAWGCVFSSADIRTNMQTVVPLTRAGGRDELDVLMSSGGEEGHSILTLLKAMQLSQHFKDARPTPASLLALYGQGTADKGHKEREQREAELNASQESTDSAKKDAMQAAKERQKALLASFAAQQKLFADTMLSDSEEEGEEQDEEQAEEKVECVICSQSAFPSEDSPVGLVCLVQRSSILADHSHKARAAFCAWRGLGGLGGEMRIAENLDSCGNLHFQSCGHHIHVSCFNSYTETLNQNQSMRDQQRFDQASGLFLCPLCRQMGNALMPLLPKGAAREAGERSRQASSLLHTCLLVPAQTDGYLRPESEKANGRSPPIPLGTMGQFESGKLAGLRIFGPALSSAVNDFLTRIVEVSGSSLVAESGAVKTAAEIDHEGLEAVVRGVGMTVGCMEMCNRDPCVESLGMRSTLVTAQERVLLHLRHLHQLAVCAHRDLESQSGAQQTFGQSASFSDVGAQLLKTMLRSRHGPAGASLGLVPEVATDVRGGGGHVVSYGIVDSQHDTHSLTHSPVSLPCSPNLGHFADDCMSAAHLDVIDGIGSARLGGYPHGRVLIAGGRLGDGAYAGEPHGAGKLEGVFSEGLPFLALDMNSVLLYMLYWISAAEVEEHGHLLVRLVYLALFVQMCMDYHVQLMASSDGAAEVAMDEDKPADSSLGLEALILSEIRNLQLPAALSHARCASAAAASLEGAAGASSTRTDLGTFESYVYRCSLPFLRRASFLLNVHSAEVAFATANAAPASIEEEWKAIMSSLLLPASPGSLAPELGDFSWELVRGWLRQLQPATRDVGCWRLIWQGFPAPQELGFPLLIPLPDLYHDLFMTYRDHKCKCCGLVPHRPALCLICGELVCFASDCCIREESGDKLFECFSHADRCHAGTGTYVILKSSMVLVIREMHWCLWGSPYLDAYGEEDQDLRRGRPLYLNRERYQQLQLLHSTHGFDHNSRVASAWHAGAQRY